MSSKIENQRPDISHICKHVFHEFVPHFSLAQQTPENELNDLKQATPEIKMETLEVKIEPAKKLKGDSITEQPHVVEKEITTFPPAFNPEDSSNQQPLAVKGKSFICMTLIIYCLKNYS